MRAKPRLATLPSQLIAGREGAAAVEFALIFPIMFTLFMGSIELTNLMMANLRTTAATEAAADLAAQTRTLNGVANLAPSDIDSFFAAARKVMTPFASTPYTTATGFKMAFAGITYNASGTAQVSWHHEENSATAITTASLDQTVLSVNAPANAATGAGLGTTGDSIIIMVKTQYTYTSPISFLLGTTYTFSDTAYNRSRYASVTCTTC